jgi:hypothetical protein
MIPAVTAFGVIGSKPGRFSPVDGLPVTVALATAAGSRPGTRRSYAIGRRIGSSLFKALDGPATSYLMFSYTLNIGRYIEMMMKPTIPPTTMIMSGSRIDVSALIDAATSSS